METIEEVQIGQVGIMLFRDEGEFGIAFAEHPDRPHPHYFKVYRTSSEATATRRFRRICNAISERKIYL